MTKLITLAALLTLAACTKTTITMEEPKQQTENRFSRVKFYKDGRTPPTDTVWTIRILDRNMHETFRAQNGYVYEETNTYVDRGVLWTEQ